MKAQKGFALLEIIVSLALLGIFGVLFLQGVMTSNKARVQADERSSAKILAESIIDNVKKAPYASSYSVPIPDDFPGYTAQIDAEYLYSTDIQKISVTVYHEGRQILVLENYKVDR